MCYEVAKRYDIDLCVRCSLLLVLFDESRLRVEEE